MSPIPLVPPVTSATRPFTENRLLTSVEAISLGFRKEDFRFCKNEIRKVRKRPCSQLDAQSESESESGNSQWWGNSRDPESGGISINPNATTEVTLWS